MPLGKLTTQVNSTNQNDFFNSQFAVSLVVPCVVLIIVIVFFLIFKKPLCELISKIKDFFIKTKNSEVGFSTEIRNDLESEKLKTEIEASAPKELEQEEDKPRWENPQSLDDWHLNMLVSFWDKDFEKAEKAYEKIQELEKDLKKRKLDKIKYLELRYCYRGDSDSLDKLIVMKEGEDKEIVASICKSIGLCHEHGENFTEAANEFIEAGKFFKNDEERIEAKIYASKNILKTKSIENASEILVEELKPELEKNLVAKIYYGLAELYNSKDNQEIRIALLEKALKLDPSDKDLLFKAGYASSELSDNFNGLSLLHYHNSLKFGSEDNTVFNNIGVQYDKLEMPIKSVNSYKKSIKKGGTLAAANLSYKYMNAGFMEDAEKILSDAKSKEDVHKNVSEATVALLNNTELEEKKEKTVLEDAEKQQKFLANFADRYFTPVATKDYSGKWKFEDGVTVNIVQDKDSNIIAIWDKEGPKKFTGKLKNLAARIVNYRTYYSRRLSGDNGEIDYLEDSKGFLFIENDSPEVVRIMNMKDGKMSFVSLRRSM